jgi:uncharacterized ferritin-like protein (DUF455 family)
MNVLPLTTDSSTGSDGPAAAAEQQPPRAGTLARWAFDYVCARALAYKLCPPALPPADHGHASDAEAHTSLAVRLDQPGRPPELCHSWDKYKAPKTAAALRDPKKRAHLLHTFFHHELQAAELMAWAVLAFPDAPLAFRRGLLHICLDEVRHMNLYAAHIAQLGYSIGAFAVRDWFWQRAPAATTPAAFVALMGLGFEAGNLDHSERYVALFREAGDEAAATLQATVGHEERAHVAFAAHWFRQLTGGFDFETWRAALPPPLSPMVMRGRPIARAARRAAGFDERFLDELELWQPTLPGC